MSTHVRRFPSWKTKLYESPAFRLQSLMMQIAHALLCTVGGVYFTNSKSIRADADFITLHIEKKNTLTEIFGCLWKVICTCNRNGCVRSGVRDELRDT